MSLGKLLRSQWLFMKPLRAGLLSFDTTQVTFLGNITSELSCKHAAWFFRKCDKYCYS